MKYKLLIAALIATLPLSSALAKDDKKNDKKNEAPRVEATTTAPVEPTAEQLKAQLQRSENERRQLQQQLYDAQQNANRSNAQMEQLRAENERLKSRLASADTMAFSYCRSQIYKAYTPEMLAECQRLMNNLTNPSLRNNPEFAAIYDFVINYTNYYNEVRDFIQAAQDDKKMRRWDFDDSWKTDLLTNIKKTSYYKKAHQKICLDKKISIGDIDYMMEDFEKLLNTQRRGTYDFISVLETYPAISAGVQRGSINTGGGSFNFNTPGGSPISSGGTVPPPANKKTSTPPQQQATQDPVEDDADQLEGESNTESHATVGTTNADTPDSVPASVKKDKEDKPKKEKGKKDKKGPKASPTSTDPETED